jgi:hypothetical protein
VEAIGLIADSYASDLYRRSFGFGVF